MKTRKRNTLLAIAIILLTIIGGAYAWSIKLSTAALDAPAVHVSDAWIRAIQRGDAEAVRDLSCNRSDEHQTVVKAQLNNISDILAAVMVANLSSVSRPLDSGEIDVNIHLTLSHEIRGKSSYNAALKLDAPRGYCVSRFALDKASWHYFEEE